MPLISSLMREDVPGGQDRTSEAGPLLDVRARGDRVSGPFSVVVIFKAMVMLHRFKGE